MSEGVPAPRKRTHPTKPRAPSKKKIVSQTKVEEAPPTIIEDTAVWEKLDDLFRTLREPQDDGVKIDKDPSCPLHTHVSLKKKVSKRGWEYVRCSEKNCQIWLPWDRHRSFVIGSPEQDAPRATSRLFLLFLSRTMYIRTHETYRVSEPWTLLFNVCSKKCTT